LALLRAGRPQEIKKGLEGPLVTHRRITRVDHPPTAVRLDTRISDLAAKVRTDVPFLLGSDFISIAAGRVKQNAAGLRRARFKCASNARLKSPGREHPRMKQSRRRHSVAAILHRTGPQNARAAC
jgi:hypothetical protein